MKPRVSLAAVPDYAPERLLPALEALLAPLGGMGAFVRPGQRVLIKPNLLAGKPPERAVTTHPEMVRAVITLVRQAGGIPLVGDSPGVGTPLGVARASGILDVVEASGATFVPFDTSVPVHVAGGTFHHLEIARPLLEADVLINLPKLKTHQMMGYTGAVKNLYGAVVGLRKVRLHLQAGTDKAFFALMLLELARHLAPALSILDGIVAMEGDGPSSGTPVKLGALLAAPDPLALDTVATALVGLRPEQVWTQRVARERGWTGTRLEEIELLGPPLASLRPARFRPAKTTDVNFGLPPLLRGPLRNALSAFPAPDHDRCVRCGLCVGHCPPAAMRIAAERLEIELDRCIRCFCCQELCPHDAILTRQGWLVRVADLLRGRS